MIKLNKQVEVLQAAIEKIEAKIETLEEKKQAIPSMILLLCSLLSGRGR